MFFAVKTLCDDTWMFQSFKTWKGFKVISKYFLWQNNTLCGTKQELIPVIRQKRIWIFNGNIDKNRLIGSCALSYI